MLAQLIQRQVSIGSEVIFSQKNGRDISGILIEIGRDHVTIETDRGPVTILMDMIGSWQILEGLSGAAQKAVEAQAPNTIDLSNHQASHQAENGSTNPVQSMPPVEPDVLRRLLEIEARFQAHLCVAKIELQPPDFAFPVEECTRNPHASVIWNRAKGRHDYASKMNELSTVFGRIQLIIADFRILENWFPSSSSVKRHLAYLFWLSGNMQEAIRACKDAAFHSADVFDWHNLAALAFNSDKEELTFYSLDKLFHYTSCKDFQNAWYIYVKLLMKLSNYKSIQNLCEIRKYTFSEEDEKIFLETCIYLLKMKGYEKSAHDLISKHISGVETKSILAEVFEKIKDNTLDSYKRISSEMEASRKSTNRVALNTKPTRLQGHIYTYNPDRDFGFLRDSDGEKFFFRRSAIIDDKLFDKLKDSRSDELIRVVFDTAQGTQGPVAIGVSLYRTVEEIFDLASTYANDGEYTKAIDQIKKVLEINETYHGAQEAYEKWSEYARTVAVPKGSNPYARAKRAHIVEKDLSKAAELFRLAIKEKDNTDSAIKDLAAVLAQKGNPQEAIDVLKHNRQKMQDQQPIENMLVGFYQKIGQYHDAIKILERKLGQCSSRGQKAQITWQIANSYFRQGNFILAENNFREVLKLQAGNMAAQRNIAICLSKQERYDEAEKILNRILDTSLDGPAAALLEAITRAKETGQFAQVDEIIIETTLSDLPRNISGFTQFFLDHCSLRGVPADRVQAKNFNRNDIQKLEELATQLGTRRAQDRAEYYLSAAKITQRFPERA